MTRSRSLATVLSLSLLVGVAGCSGSSDKVGSPSTSASGGSSTTVETPTPPATLTPDSGNSAGKYIKDTYTSAAWAKDISKISVADNKLSAQTTLGTSKKDKASAKQICTALSGYQVTNEGGFKGVVVKSKDGKVLASRSSLAKPC